MFAYYVHDLSPFIIRFTDNFGLRWYGLAYVLAFVLGYFLLKRLSRQGYSELNESQVNDFVTYGALFGVLLGGRLGYMLFYDFNEFLANPLRFFYFLQGGMASHGGILGLFFFTLYYARRKKISWTNLGDNLVTVAPIGLFLGRCANFINGELYGRVSSVPWAMIFPSSLREEPPHRVEPILRACTDWIPQLKDTFLSFGEKRELLIQHAQDNSHIQAVLEKTLSPRHPSQIYEALLEGALLFGILYFVRTRFRTPNGMLTGLFFLLYALFRIFVEQYREPDSPLLLDLTKGQFYSLFMILFGICFLFYGWKRNTLTGNH